MARHTGSHLSASHTLRTLVLIGTGGFIGSILRYLLSGYVQQLSKGLQFPFGTLAVNVVGCVLIGFLAELADQRGIITDETRGFLIVGILGGFTTFSAFGNETMGLLRQRRAVARWRQHHRPHAAQPHRRVARLLRGCSALEMIG